MHGPTEPAGAEARLDAQGLDERVRDRHWYHTLELAPGVLTPGYFDHRGIVDLLLPRSCEGMRCLDIGTFDGFWAFEMERRGAEEVVAIDILDDGRWDWPAQISDEARRGVAERKGAGDGFLIASERLGSAVTRLDLSVHELDPAGHGSFDLVFLGSLLHHLRDPVEALRRAGSVCRGRLAVLDAISLWLDFAPFALADFDRTGRPCWWKPNRRALAGMASAAGLDIIAGPHRILVPVGRGLPSIPLRPRTLATREGRELAAMRTVGGIHARFLARPVEQ